MAPVAVLFHMRYTRPLVGFLMVVVGLTISWVIRRRTARLVEGGEGVEG